MDYLTVTKLEAAERQLAQAIRLFFEEADPLSIHTLVSASLGILNPYAKAQGITGPIGPYSKFIDDKDRKAWISFLNAPANFLKHADKDPDATLTFVPKFTEFSIFNAMCILEKLGRNQLVVTSPIFWYQLKVEEIESYHLSKGIAGIRRIPASGGFSGSLVA